MYPFVKWAGGKRQLLDKITSRLPKECETYYEPFVGGGAVLFALEPKKAVINDFNAQLINVYNQIKSNASEVIKTLSLLDKTTCTLDYYQKIRSAYNQKIRNNETDLELACLFVYLNKHCFNGLYRVNSKNEFNVPWNQKGIISSFDKNNITKICTYLNNKKITIMSGDFEKSLSKARIHDFIFFDSPYAPLKATSFSAYTNAGFSESDHIRLANLFKKLDKKGCYCMLTNHNTQLINNLYKDYKIEVVPVRRSINSKANNRHGEEVIITNYDNR